ncbi:hypothetical protein BC332_27583 [Capsicum chinense]|nr:hypothetical protein BC332_27583 [Capsicum chinense]
MEKQKSFRIAMERQMSFGGGERKRGKDSPGKRVDSPLHLAARVGNLGKVKEIFQKFEGKGIKDLLYQQNQEGETALYVAAENGNSLVVSEFLKHLDLKTASIVTNNGCDALHVAARQDSNVLGRILFTVLSILKTESFSRDCLVAARVTFCVALQVCLSPEELGLFIMEGIFNESFIVCPKFVFANVVEKISFKGNLIDKLSKFSSLSSLCLVRGILSVVSRTILHIGALNKLPSIPISSKSDIGRESYGRFTKRCRNRPGLMVQMLSLSSDSDIQVPSSTFLQLVSPHGSRTYVSDFVLLIDGCFLSDQYESVGGSVPMAPQSYVVEALSD